MRYRQLGSSDLNVSEISLGSWLTYGGGVERDSAEACVEKAFEVGINFIDTANVYSRGRAEEFLGEVLAGRPRDSYVLATKLYWPMSETDRGLSLAQVEKQIDASLSAAPHRLRRPLPVPSLRLGDAARGDDGGAHRRRPRGQGALPRLLANGRRSRSGRRSSCRAWRSSSPASRSTRMLWRGPEEDVIPLCAPNGISQIVWSPLAQGVLTGKYAPGEAPPAESRATSDSMGSFMDEFMRDDVLEAVQRLRPIAEGLGITVAQLALAWVLREPNVASAIVGASRPEQVADNAAASGVDLDESTLAAIEDAVGDVAERRSLPASAR